MMHVSEHAMILIIFNGKISVAHARVRMGFMKIVSLDGIFSAVISSFNCVDILIVCYVSILNEVSVFLLTQFYMHKNVRG